MHRNGDFFGVLHHVVVGQYVALGRVDDDPGTDAAAAIAPLESWIPEEPLKKRVVHDRVASSGGVDRRHVHYRRNRPAEHRCKGGHRHPFDGGRQRRTDGHGQHTEKAQSDPTRHPVVQPALVLAHHPNPKPFISNGFIPEQHLAPGLRASGTGYARAPDPPVSQLASSNHIRVSPCYSTSPCSRSQPSAVSHLSPFVSPNRAAP